MYGRLRTPSHLRRFADLSEPDYGVALLNDCKFGHATHGSCMRLTLLRAPKCPDPKTDIGHHTMRYAVLPHANGWQAGGVVPAALAFNQPLVMTSCGVPSPQHQQPVWSSPSFGGSGLLASPFIEASVLSLTCIYLCCSP